MRFALIVIIVVLYYDFYPALMNMYKANINIHQIDGDKMINEILKASGYKRNVSKNYQLRFKGNEFNLKITNKEVIK